MAFSMIPQYTCVDYNKTDQAPAAPKRNTELDLFLLSTINFQKQGTTIVLHRDRKQVLTTDT